MYKIYNSITNEFSGVQYSNVFWAMAVAEMMSNDDLRYTVIAGE